MTLGVLSLIGCNNDADPGYFVALSDNKTAAYSTDGINWKYNTTNTAISDAVMVWENVCYGDGKFIAVPRNGEIAAYSTNGIDWTTLKLPLYARWYSISYGLDSDIFGFL